MRLPLLQKAIHFINESIGGIALDRSVAAEYPHARLIRQGLEWNDRHVEKDIRLELPGQVASGGGGAEVARYSASGRPNMS